jgi:hypothetical protein
MLSSASKPWVGVKRPSPAFSSRSRQPIAEVTGDDDGIDDDSYIPPADDFHDDEIGDVHDDGDKYHDVANFDAGAADVDHDENACNNDNVFYQSFRKLQECVRHQK